MRHGFLLIDKPLGPTSHDIVAMVRKQLHERSVGHLGTLDPAATGLLVLAVGRKALKIVELFADLPKEYEAHVRLGSVSTTYDSEGVIEDVPVMPGWEIPTEVAIRNLLVDRFIGKISQVPPAHSAVHVGGERAYRKAMRGQGVNVPPRSVEIKRCDILSYSYPDLRLRVSCGSGTYIRSLAHDLGQLLHFGGYLAGLRRTKVGEWSVDQAKPPDAVAWTDVMPLKDVLQHLPGIELTEGEWDDLQHGRDIERYVEGEHAIGWYEELPVVLLEPRGEGTAHPRKVL